MSKGAKRQKALAEKRRQKAARFASHDAESDYIRRRRKKRQTVVEPRPVWTACCYRQIGMCTCHRIERDTL